MEDFIRLTPHRQNLQCSLIAGIKNDGTCDERTLDQAKRNLADSFSAVGICERFEESLVLFAEIFGWQVPFYENRKVSKNCSRRTAAGRSHDSGNTIGWTLSFMSLGSNSLRRACASERRR